MDGRDLRAGVYRHFHLLANPAVSEPSAEHCRGGQPPPSSAHVKESVERMCCCSPLDLWFAGAMRDKGISTVNQDMEPSVASSSMSTPIPANPASLGCPAFGVPPFFSPLSIRGAAAVLSIIHQGWSQAGASAPALLNPPGARRAFPACFHF